MANKLAIRNSFQALYVVNTTGDIEANEHLTQMELLLDNTLNIDDDAVSQVDAEAGTATDLKLWTPERVQQAIASLERRLTSTSNAAPAGGNGNVGNFNIDLVTGILYEKTGASTWTAVLDSLTREISFDQAASNSLAMTSANVLSGILNSTDILNVDATTDTNPTWRLGSANVGVSGHLQYSGTQIVGFAPAGGYNLVVHDGTTARTGFSASRGASSSVYAIGNNGDANDNFILIGDTVTVMNFRDSLGISLHDTSSVVNHDMLVLGQSAGGDFEWALGKDTDGQLNFDATENKFSFIDGSGDRVGLVPTGTTEGDIFVVNSDNDLVRLPAGNPLEIIRVVAAGSGLEYTSEYVARDTLETDTGGSTKLVDYAIFDRYEAINDNMSGTSSFTVPLRNALGANPTVAAATTISIEMFDYKGKRLAGGAWEYQGTVDINADAPDASEPSANTYGSHTGITDLNDDAISFTGWTDISTYFTGSIDSTTHEFQFTLNRYQFAVQNNLAASTLDAIEPGRLNYTILISVQEGNNMRSVAINCPSMTQVDPGVRYSFGHVSDQSVNPTVLYVAGEYVGIGDPTNGKENVGIVVGGGTLDTANSNLVAGRSKITPNTLYWTQGSWDVTTTAVNVGIRYDLHPFMIAAQAAWVGTNSGNTGVWLYTPNAAYTEGIFARKFDIEQITLTPPSGSANAQYVGACFDHTTATNGRGNIFYQDQASTMYYATYDGADYQPQSLTLWTLEATYLVDIYWIDANNMVVISRTGNSGSTAFEYYKYNAGAREEQASWTRFLVNTTGAFAKGIWTDGNTTNGELDFYTIDQKFGHPVKFEYDGANYGSTSGNTLYSDVSDDTAYGGEIQSVNLLNNEDNTAQVVFGQGRKLFNRDGYQGMFFALDGRLITTTEAVGTWRRNGSSILSRPATYF